MPTLRKVFHSQATLRSGFQVFAPETKEGLIQEEYPYKKHYEKLIQSKSWRYTEIFRIIFGSFRIFRISIFRLVGSINSSFFRNAFMFIKIWKKYFFYSYIDRIGRKSRFTSVNLPDLSSFPLLAKSLNRQFFIRKGNFKGDADWSLVLSFDVALSQFALIQFLKAVTEYPHASHFYCDTVDSQGNWSFVKPSWDPIYNASIPLLPPLYFVKSNVNGFSPVKLKDVLVTEPQRSSPSIVSNSFGVPAIPLIRLAKSREALSVVIPTANKRISTPEGNSWLLKSIVTSIADSKNLGKVEIVIVDNGNVSDAEKRELSKYLEIKFVTDKHKKLNLSRKINMGVSLARSEKLILCNDDIELENSSSISFLIPWLDQESVGVVGPRIHYLGGQLQYAGVSVVDGKCHILGYKQPSHEMGHAWAYSIPRFVSAVTGVLQATTRTCFDSVKGWDESFPVNFNDIDYCLRANSMSFKTVFEPRSRIFHLESASRDISLPYIDDENRFITRWESHNDFWPELPFLQKETGPESSHIWRKRHLQKRV